MLLDRDEIRIDVKATTTNVPSQQVVDEGSAVVFDFLRKWMSQSPADDGTNGDIVMTDDISLEDQLSELRQCYEEFRPQVEKNEWCQSVLAAL